MADEEKQHIIRLPEDTDRVAQLRAKHQEYQGRLDPFDHPELRARHNWDAFCKEWGLRILLEKGVLDTHTLSLELAREFPDAFDVDGFNNAMGVIDNYVTTGGKGIKRGKGLPPVPTPSQD